MSTSSISLFRKGSISLFALRFVICCAAFFARVFRRKLLRDMEWRKATPRRAQRRGSVGAKGEWMFGIYLNMSVLYFCTLTIFTFFVMRLRVVHIICLFSINYTRCWYCLQMHRKLQKCTLFCTNNHAAKTKHYLNEECTPFPLINACNVLDNACVGRSTTNKQT